MLYYVHRDCILATCNFWTLTKLKDGLLCLHEADDDAIKWLQNTAAAALTKCSFEQYLTDI